MTPSDVSGEYAERGDYHRAPDRAWDYLPTYLAKLARVRGWLNALPAGTPVLDAGCGEGVLAQPGIAPVPQGAPTPAQGEFFNPYNLPADWVPPPAVPTSGTPVEPDRAKYSNPYNPSQPPE